MKITSRHTASWSLAGWLLLIGGACVAPACGGDSDSGGSGGSGGSAGGSGGSTGGSGGSTGGSGGSTGGSGGSTGGSGGATGGSGGATGGSGGATGGSGGATGGTGGATGGTGGATGGSGGATGGTGGATGGTGGATDGGADASTGGTGGAIDAGTDASTDAGTDSGTDSGPGDAAPADGGVVGTSCQSAHTQYPSLPSGVYTIDPDGAGGEAPFPVVCDMTTGGGGWTLALLKNSVHNGSYATFASSYFNVSALATTPEAASSNASGTAAAAGWINLNTFSYTELVLAGYKNGVSFFRSANIPKTALRIAFGQNGYFLYNDPTGYYWCGGAASYTNDGVGQVNPPAGAPADCKGHTSLGNGWDFGGQSYNTSLTVCGGGSMLMTAGPASGYTAYPTPGVAQAFWVR